MEFYMDVRNSFFSATELTTFSTSFSLAVHFLCIPTAEFEIVISPLLCMTERFPPQTDPSVRLNIPHCGLLHSQLLTFWISFGSNSVGSIQINFSVFRVRHKSSKFRVFENSTFVFSCFSTGQKAVSWKRFGVSPRCLSFCCAFFYLFSPMKLSLSLLSLSPPRECLHVIKAILLC